MSGTPTRATSSQSGGTRLHRRHHSHTPSRASDTLAAQPETTTTTSGTNTTPTPAVVWGVYLHPSVLRLRTTAQDIFFALLQLGCLERCPAVVDLPAVAATTTTRLTAATRNAVTTSVDPTHDKMLRLARKGQSGSGTRTETGGRGRGDAAGGHASATPLTTSAEVEAWLQRSLRGDAACTPQLVSFSYVLAAMQPSTAEQRVRLESNAMMAEMELERPNTFETILIEPTAPGAAHPDAASATHRLATFSLTRNAERMEALERVLSTPRPAAADAATPTPQRSGAVGDGDGGAGRGGHRRTLLHDVLTARRRTQERQVSSARAAALGLQRYLSQARCCARYPLHLYTPTAAVPQAVLCEQLIGHGEGAGLHDSALMPGVQLALATMMVGEEASFVIRAPQTYASSLLWGNGGGGPAPRAAGAMSYVNCPEADYLLPYCMKSALHIQIKLHQRTPLHCTLTLPTAHFALATGGAASQYSICVFVPPPQKTADTIKTTTTTTTTAPTLRPAAETTRHASPERGSAADVAGASHVSSFAHGVTPKEVSSSSMSASTPTMSPTRDDAMRPFAFFRHRCRGAQCVVRCGLEVYSAPTQRYISCLPRRAYALGAVSLPLWLAHALASIPLPPPLPPSAAQPSDAAATYCCYLVTQGELDDEACTLRNLLTCLAAVATSYGAAASTAGTAATHGATPALSNCHTWPPRGLTSGGSGGAARVETVVAEAGAALKSGLAKVESHPLTTTSSVTEAGTNGEGSLSTLGNESCVAALQVPRYSEMRYRVTLEAAGTAPAVHIVHFASDPVRALRHVRAVLNEVCALMTFYVTRARAVSDEEGTSGTGLRAHDGHPLPHPPFELYGEAISVHFPHFARRARSGQEQLARLLLSEAAAAEERDADTRTAAAQLVSADASSAHRAVITLDDVLRAMHFIPLHGLNSGSPPHCSPTQLRQRCLRRILCKVAEKLYWCLYLLLDAPSFDEVRDAGSGTLAACTDGAADVPPTTLSRPASGKPRGNAEDRLAHSLPATRAPRPPPAHRSTPPCTTERTTLPRLPSLSTSHSSSCPSPSSSLSSSLSSSPSCLTTSSCSSFEPATSPRPPPATEAAHVVPRSSPPPRRAAPPLRHNPRLLRRRRNYYVAECFHYAALVAREVESYVVTLTPNTAQELCSAALVYAPHRPSSHLLRAALLAASGTTPSPAAPLTRDIAVHDLQAAITDIQERANRLLATARSAAAPKMARTRRDALVEAYRRRLEKLHKVLRRLQRQPPQDVAPNVAVRK